MGSRGAYAGQPYWFCCSKCRRKPAYHARRETPEFTTTGKTRKQRSRGSNYHFWGDVAYQYRCACGHVGWSRHPTVALRFKQEHPDKVEEEASV